MDGKIFDKTLIIQVALQLTTLHRLLRLSGHFLLDNSRLTTHGWN